MDPHTAPSGKPSQGYGEIMIKVWFTGENEAEAAVAAPPGLPFPFFMVAVEHLMTAVAMKSDAGFDRALELFVEGAKKNRGLMVDRDKVRYSRTSRVLRGAYGTATLPRRSTRGFGGPSKALGGKMPDDINLSTIDLSKYILSRADKSRCKSCNRLLFFLGPREGPGDTYALCTCGRITKGGRPGVIEIAATEGG